MSRRSLFQRTWRATRQPNGAGANAYAWDVEQLADFSIIGPGRGVQSQLRFAPGRLYVAYTPPLAGVAPVTGSIAHQRLFDPYSVEPS